MSAFFNLHETNRKHLLYVNIERCFAIHVKLANTSQHVDTEFQKCHMHSGQNQDCLGMHSNYLGQNHTAQECMGIFWDKIKTAQVRIGIIWDRIKTAQVCIEIISARIKTPRYAQEFLRNELGVLGNQSSQNRVRCSQVFIATVPEISQYSGTVFSCVFIKLSGYNIVQNCIAQKLQPAGKLSLRNQETLNRQKQQVKIRTPGIRDQNQRKESTQSCRRSLQNPLHTRDISIATLITRYQKLRVYETDKALRRGY